MQQLAEVLAHSILFFREEAPCEAFNIGVDSPPPRDYATETYDNLYSQIQLAPMLYAAKANPNYGDSAYTKLGLGNLQTSAFGTDGQMGLLDMYTKARPQLDALAAQNLAAQRQADVGAVSQLGPQAREAMRTANPENARLLDQMNQIASSGLAAGSQLTPDQQRQVSQQSRSAFSDRGLSSSPSSAFNEVLAGQMAGQGIQQQRMAQAGGVFQGNQSFYGDPFQQILGRPSQGMNSMFNAFSQAGGQQRQAGNLNPESAYGQDIFNTNFNAKAAAGIANANNYNALIGAGISAL